jgi:hypothetical protein
MLLARPRGARTPIVSGALALPVEDPVWALRRQLERAYLDRLTIDPVRVLRFLERRVPPHGESLASNLHLETVDDFLAFEALRRAIPQVVTGTAPDALARGLTRHFVFTPMPDEAVDNEWLRCAGFRVRRLSDHVTMEAARAS